MQGNLRNWKIKRVGHASKGKEHSKINRDLKDSLNRKITISLIHVYLL